MTPELCPTLLFALNHLPTLVILTDEHGTVSAVFGESSSRTGIDGRACVGQPAVACRSLPIRANHIRSALGGERFTAIVPHDGTQYETTYVPIKKDGQVVGIVCQSLDMAPRIKADKEFDELQFAATATHRLHTLQEFAGRVAHEILNPLQIISGKCSSLADMIQAGKFEASKATNTLRSVEQSCFRIKRIIGAVVDTARDASRDPPGKFDACETVRQCAELLAPRFEDNAVTLVIETTPAPLFVLGRRVQVMQALQALLENAVDAVARKPGSWVRVEAAERNGAIEISVTDSGDGIPEHVRHRIFQPLFTTKPVNKGTGLGLPVARRDVESNGGKLDLDAASANTRFVMTFPVAK